MQVTRIRKGMLWTLVMVLLCTMLPVAMAAQTTLSVSFNGLRATSEGQWMTEPLTGTFEVWSGTTLLGQVTSHPQDGSADTLALSSTEEITLRPVMETMPEGYLIQDAPISVSIAEGKENNPPVLVYADAGLFTVQGEVNASFAVLKLQQDEAGEETLEEVLTFSLDETGNYILPQAIAAGDYVLRQLTAAPGRALGPDLPFQLVAYKGDGGRHSPPAGGGCNGLHSHPHPPGSRHAHSHTGCHSVPLCFLHHAGPHGSSHRNSRARRTVSSAARYAAAMPAFPA